MKDDRFQFTNDWVTANAKTWLALLQPLIGLPIRALEIGTCEGRSALWWLDHVLTNPAAHLLTIDPHRDAGRYQRCLWNLAQHERCSQVSLVRGMSRQIVSHVADESLDFAYVDGSHEALDVILDGCLVWHKLKAGGLLIFDDYLWEPPPGRLPPKPAIDAFVQLTGAKVIHREYQLTVVR